tara:strand:+ start:849 stop:1283 length:435 start_codon:yes stop_codon:yes gene_type:complete
MKTVDLTDRELEMIMTALDAHTERLAFAVAGSLDPNVQLNDEINEFNELRDDLLATSAGHHDDWPPHIHVNDADERFNDAIPDAADQLIQIAASAPVSAEERARLAFGDSDMRLGSMAAQRRAARLQVQRMMQGTVTPFVGDDE